MPAPTETLPRILHLLAFDTVATGGSMRHAANALHLTQPAITYAIHALERRLGTVLLTRGRGGSFLTQAGALFAKRAARSAAQLRAAISAATGLDPDGEAVSRHLRQLTDSQLRALVAIDAAQSFRAAAGALGIAEPSLHRPARDIELMLKVNLYRRTPAGLGLSPTGAELARRFLLVMAEIRAGIADVAGSAEAAEARIGIGVLPLAPKTQLIEVVESLLTTHPALRASVIEGSYDDLVRELRSGAIDVVFGALRAPSPFADLAERPILDDPYVVVCRQGHALVGRKGLKPVDIAGFGWVFPTPSLPRRKVLDGILAAWGIVPKVQLETNSIGAIAASVMVSDRLSLWPRSSVEAEPHFAALSVLDIVTPQAKRLVGLTHREDWLPTAIQTTFLARFVRSFNLQDD